MTAISQRQPEVDVTYDYKGSRKTKHFTDTHKAKQWYVIQDRMGKHPAVKRSDTVTEVEAAEIEVESESPEIRIHGDKFTESPEMPSTEKNKREAETSEVDIMDQYPAKRKKKQPKATKPVPKPTRVRSTTKKRSTKVSTATKSKKSNKKATSKKVTTVKASGKVKSNSKPSANPAPKRKDGLRKPQLRILEWLAKQKKARTRAEISKGAIVDLATLNEYIGSHDNDRRAANDQRFFPCLRTLKMIKVEQEDVDGRDTIVHTITVVGRKATGK